MRSVPELCPPIRTGLLTTSTGRCRGLPGFGMRTAPGLISKVYLHDRRCADEPLMLHTRPAEILEPSQLPYIRDPRV